MKTVAVLMSTYNGSKYVFQQIESVLNQESVNVDLYIRDDGSSDDTVKIIKSIKDKRIKLIEGRNLGVIGSFFCLINMVPDYQYYAFSDQDDVWKADKLFEAVKPMNNEEKAELSIGSYYLVDEHLTKITPNIRIQQNYNLVKTIVYNAPLGCTMVYNRKMMEYLKMYTPSCCRMHDHWLMLVAELCDANIFYSNNSIMYYRQHASNVVGNKKSKIVRMKRLLRSAMQNRYERSNQVIEANGIFRKMMNDDSCRYVDQIINYRKSFLARFSLAFDHKWTKQIGNKSSLFRMSILLGLF